MANKILHKRSGTATNVPAAGSLDHGELAINYADKKIYIKDSANNVVCVAQDQAAVSTDIIPAADITYDLGSPTHQWRDVYIGPGSLYVNGQKVLEDNSGTIVVSADQDQNVQIKSTGTGDIEFLPSGTGVVQVKGAMSILAGKNIMSSDGNAISVTDDFTMNGNLVRGLGTPTLGTDAANKTYVDTAITTGNAAQLNGFAGSYYLDWANTTNKPDPTITLAGDATGSVTLTDLANGTLTVTIVDDSHNHVISNVDGLQTALDAKLNLTGGTLSGALAINSGSAEALTVTTTTRDIVASFTSGDANCYITFADNNTSIAPYIGAVGDDLIMVAPGGTGTVTVQDNLTVTGNLIVQGTTTTVNSNNVHIGDNIITLSANETGVPSLNGGFEIERGTSTNVGVRWNETTDVWEASDNAGTYYPILTTNSTVDADTLGGVASGSFVRSDAADTISGILTFNARPAFNGGTSGSTSPFTVDSTQVVANLNADLLDGQQGSYYAAAADYLPLAGGVLTGNTRFAAKLHTGTVAGVIGTEAGSIGIYTGSSGVASAEPNADDLVIENDSSAGISILTPNGSNGAVYFGDPESNTVGRILYSHGSNAMFFYANDLLAYTIDSGRRNIFAATLPDVTLRGAPGAVTISTGDSGLTTASTAADDLIIESGANAGITIATPNTNTGSVYFGDPQDADVGGISYDHANNRLLFTTNANWQLIIESDGTLHANAANYETLVTDDDDIPNKKYVDDAITTGAHPLGYPSFSEDSVVKDDITTRTDSGFYETSTGTTAEGWPVTTNNWQHMIACTHGNNGNYYSMQIAGPLSDQNFYGRKTNNSGTTAWSKFWTDTNDGAGSGLDADLLDGQQGSAYMRTNQANTHTGNIVPSADNTYNLGSGAAGSATVYASLFDGEATTAQYADLAEIYSADADIKPGTVVCFGGTAEVTTCMHDMDRKVAGVVSTKPAHLMNAGAEGVAVALQGRVPCKVTGTVRKGDMMVSAGGGMARAEENPVLGSVIGKALQDYDGEVPGVIEVVVGRL